MRIRSILLLTALLVAACSKPAPPTLPWERISPLPTDADLHALAAARGRTVAAGEGGTILTSTDGETWTLRPTGTTDDLFGVTAAPAGWVAVGDGAILTSPDAVTWTPRTGAANKDLRAVACGPQTCVAVGDKGAAVAEKPSGKWAPVAMGTENDLLSVAYANGKFIATGARGTALASADGQAWTPLKPPLPEPPQGFYNDLVSVMFTQDTWVIGVAGWGSFVLTSRD
ncbi:MAG TPA: hypothetical protein VNT75_15560, partial [Symbiobacteriaceae bacterium]|nr:hypothetical protein [Symbiobacteriaceae bacterium]